MQIVTIHKSKGSEYPLVWLPFYHPFPRAGPCFLSRQAPYDKRCWTQSRRREYSTGEAERLAEDLRLLYRADPCSVALQPGVAPLVRRRSDKKGETDVPKRA
ncbi:hypothetical protein KCP77_06635 [Salmonella enterica subsp. enterica]|nr:hypothetical protein KCP77_06635 [Salmonella enterica subsp. enterica]